MYIWFTQVFFKFLQKQSSPANIYLFKVHNENTKKGVKHLQS